MKVKKNDSVLLDAEKIDWLIITHLLNGITKKLGPQGFVPSVRQVQPKVQPHRRVPSPRDLYEDR